MKVSNLINARGNTVANQFLLEDVSARTFRDAEGAYLNAGEAFQSYDSMIAFKDINGQVWLDENTWDYSVTTGKYRNQFLDEGIAVTRTKIASGEYKLTDLNR